MRPVRTLAALGVLIAALVFAWSAMETSSARVSASTETASFFTAAVVTLHRPDASAELLFDAAGLYPGLVTSGCVEIVYDGSVPATVRLHGATVGGTGLEDYVEITVLVSRSGPGCALDDPATEVFRGRLSDLWRSHADFGDGLPLASPARPGDRLAVRVAATVVDDDRAQGLTTDFSFSIEARP